MFERIIQWALCAALAIALLATAPPADAKDKQLLVGSWVGTAAATTVPLPPVTDLITFTSDGTVVETQRLYLADTPWDPRLRTAGHGEWASTGDREFAVTLVVIYQGAPNHPTTPGEVLALEKVRMKVRLEHRGNQLSGTLLDEVRDMSGHVIFLAPGTYAATRISVGPLP